MRGGKIALTQPFHEALAWSVVCEGAWQIPEEPKERGIKMEGNYHDLVQM